MRPFGAGWGLSLKPHMYFSYDPAIKLMFAFALLSGCLSCSAQWKVENPCDKGGGKVLVLALLGFGINKNYN